MPEARDAPDHRVTKIEFAVLLRVAGTPQRIRKRRNEALIPRDTIEKSSAENFRTARLKNKYEERSKRRFPSWICHSGDRHGPTIADSNNIRSPSPSMPT